MKNDSLHYNLYIKAISRIKGKVKQAKVSFIKQDGIYKQGRWGLANKKNPKIYILKHNKDVIYVGITKMALSSRFRYGLSASGKHGYHGYAWKQLAKKSKSDLIDLFVFIFRNEEWAEAIEAEIVYLIRKETGKWPKYQTEIHFHQANRAEKRMAQSIYKQISKSSL